VLCGRGGGGIITTEGSYGMRRWGREGPGLEVVRRENGAEGVRERREVGDLAREGVRGVGGGRILISGCEIGGGAEEDESEGKVGRRSEKERVHGVRVLDYRGWNMDSWLPVWYTWRL
jgi:hypothetical protein